MGNKNGGGILSGPVDGPVRVRNLYAEVPADVGVTATHRASAFRGKIVGFEADGVTLRSSSSGLERHFRMAPGAFSVDGQAVTLVKPKVAASASSTSRTASGSVATRSETRIAQPSRILVEGVHDAELVEKVWGDDLRHEGIVVERLDGLDVVEPVVKSFRPGPGRRLGILVDHLVPGSKESRLTEALVSDHVLVTGTPFIDVWQAIRPKAAGIERWPEIPRNQPWKEGICAHFGAQEPGLFWKLLLSKVGNYSDLEPDFVGAVESLIDFVTATD